MDKVSIGSSNGLLSVRCQAIAWTNTYWFTVKLGPTPGNKFQWSLNQTTESSFKISSAKWWTFCSGLDVLTVTVINMIWGHLARYYIEMGEIWLLKSLTLNSSLTRAVEVGHRFWLVGRYWRLNRCSLCITVKNCHSHIGQCHDQIMINVNLLPWTLLTWYDVKSHS